MSERAVNPSGRSVGIAIVSYNVRDLLRGCLASLRLVEGCDHVDVVVVDNASSDASADMVLAEFQEVQIVCSAENLGYPRANNVALEKLRSMAHRHDFLLLLNPDTVVPPLAIRRMVDLFEEFPSIGAAGPRLVRGDGSIDWACRRGFPTPMTSTYHLMGLGRLFPQSRQFGRYRMTFLDERALAVVDAVVGAFMMVRGEVVDAVGLLDESFFMYGEDIDWAFRIKEAGWKVVYDGRVDVRHYKRESSRQSNRAQVEFYRSMRVFFRKHYASITPPPMRWLIEAVVGILLMNTILRRSFNRRVGLLT